MKPKQAFLELLPGMIGIAWLAIEVEKRTPMSARLHRPLTVKEETLDRIVDLTRLDWSQAGSSYCQMAKEALDQLEESRNHL